MTDVLPPAPGSSLAPRGRAAMGLLPPQRPRAGHTARSQRQRRVPAVGRGLEGWDEGSGLWGLPLEFSVGSAAWRKEFKASGERGQRDEGRLWVGLG